MIGSISGNGIGEFASLRAMRLNQLSLAQAQQRLATGLRVNSGADDPAGLIAVTEMGATLAALDAETASNERAIAVADTADAALGQASDLLTQAKSLALANANTSGLSDSEKQANQLEIDSILASVDRIADTTSFNRQKLLDGSGSVRASGQETKIDALDVSAAKADPSAESFDTLINSVATTRGKLGAFSRDKLQTRVNDISSARENMLSTISVIRDADIASETSAQIRAELLQSATAILFKHSSKPVGTLLNLLA